MNENKLGQIWLSELLEHEQVHSFRDLEPEINDKEITTIIFSDISLDEDKAIFLSKILQSCGLEENKYKILSQCYPFKHLKNAFPKLEYIFLFGMNINEIGLNLKINEVDALYFSEIQIISCVSLSKLEGQAQLKTQFWNQILKPIFKK